MDNAFKLCYQHKKRLLSSLLIFIFLTFLAGILLLTISFFTLTKNQYKAASITAQSASLFLSPYLFAGKLAQSCSTSVIYNTLTLLTHAQQGSQLIDQITKEYNDDGVKTETIQAIQPYIKTIDDLVQSASACKQSSPIFRSFLTVFFQKNSNLLELSKLSTLLTSLTHNYQTVGGYDSPQHILILLQNNRELRATGGFLGSYAYLTIEYGKIVNVELQDIYVPDGQLSGHVEPPKPIQDAFHQGFWKLRDANWHPDFPQSVTNISWFFEQAGWQEPDAVIAVDVTAIENILQNIEPIYLTEFEKTYHADEIYPLLQTEVEEDFFAGSTKKRDLLNHVYTQIFLKLSNTTSKQKLELLLETATALDQKHILLFSNVAEIQNVIENNNFAGKIENPNDTDYFAIFESNLGVNKSNCCVLRSVNLEKKTSDNHTDTKTTIHYMIDSIPDNLSKIAGDYKSYIRVYFPEETSLQYVKVNQQEYLDYISEQKQRSTMSPNTPAEPSESVVNGMKEVGIWIYVPQKSFLDIEIITNTEAQSINPGILIQKQPGTMDFFNHFKVTINNKEIFNDILTRDIVVDR